MSVGRSLLRARLDNEDETTDDFEASEEFDEVELCVLVAANLPELMNRLLFRSESARKRVPCRGASAFGVRFSDKTNLPESVRFLYYTVLLMPTQITYG